MKTKYWIMAKAWRLPLCRGTRQRFVVLALVIGLGPPGAWAERAGSALFDRSTMTQVDLSGLKVWLGRPVTVTSQISWGVRVLTPEGRPEMMYTHFFPSLARFPGGNVIATYCMDPDSGDNPMYANAVQISRDDGATWGRRYNLLLDHNTHVFVPLAGDTLLALPSELTQRSIGDTHDLAGPATRFEHGGDRIVIVPDGVKILDWPWPLGMRPQNQPRDNWRAHFTLLGDSVRIGNTILATASVPPPEDHYAYADVVLIASTDEGQTWRYYSTVAPVDPAWKSQPGYEGACEPGLVRLGDGELMVVFRVGGGARWHLRRTYSRDQGRTWSTADVLPAFSVMPSIVRTARGLLAISSGRPGLGVWFSRDPRGRHWETIDIVAYHNAWAPDPSYRIDAPHWGGAASYEQNPLYPRPQNGKMIESPRIQTTSYTKLLEVGPNRLLLIYDRDAVIRPPDRPPQNLQDVSRVFVLPIEVGLK